ncbi:Gfo/Idh/MocA family protein [Paenibacillus sp. 32O-W]|uniref:Gfo/Idh/MocA family protein n=1 Tax=Paenibacillus sp. 32O-W TaxID=1695218 RepID=UPI00164308FC|nr:Gfo/Idh/MocA family oxidoreductase [Paenibacillus sp. 32O-W]
MKKRIIIIGAGWAGQHHARAVYEHHDTELAAIIDRGEEAAGALAQKLGGVPYYQSLEELERQGTGYDAAVICTLPDTHASFCKALLQRGKHLFCEKPAGKNSGEIAWLLALSRTTEAIAGVNYNQRYSPCYRKLKDKISGEKPHLIAISMQQQGPVKQSDLAHPYFIVTDSCCHMIDTLRYINGEIRSVYAVGKRIDSEILSDVAVSLEFRNGSIGVMTHTFVGGVHESQHPFQHFELSTDKARYEVTNMLEGLHTYPHHSMERTTWSPSVFESCNYAETLKSSIHAWIESLTGSSPAPVDLLDAYRNALVVEACIKSLETGLRVQLQDDIETGGGLI